VRTEWDNKDEDNGDGLYIQSYYTIKNLTPSCKCSTMMVIQLKKKE